MAFFCDFSSLQRHLDTRKASKGNDKTMSEKEKRSEDFIENVDGTRRRSIDDLREKLPPSGSAERVLAERKLVRKLDMRLLPTIFLIFIMNYIDVREAFSISSVYSGLNDQTASQRNGVTTARLKGMQQDLHISGKPRHHHDHFRFLI